MAEHNGKSVAPSAPTLSPDEQIDVQLRQAIGFMVRGILVSAPGVPPEMIAKSIARITGELIGQAVCGDIVAVLTIRRECKENFTKSMGDMPVRPLPSVTSQKLNA